jgi:hypothetical protein
MPHRDDLPDVKVFMKDGVKTFYHVDGQIFSATDYQPVGTSVFGRNEPRTAGKAKSLPLSYGVFRKPPVWPQIFACGGINSAGLVFHVFFKKILELVLRQEA